MLQLSLTHGIHMYVIRNEIVTAKLLVTIGGAVDVVVVGLSVATNSRNT